MKNRGDALINRAAEMIVIISSVAVIALMAVGGCNNGGHGEPAPTGFPPECEGTFDVDLSCPATSLAGSVCLPYSCDVIDDGVEPPMVIDSIIIVFGDHCTDTDCFTLECQDISVIGADSATIIIESVSGTPVGEDVEGSVFQGLPDGRIIIDGEEFALDCTSIITP
ncbi:MAG: hypothetical protein AB1598_05095 [Thermodesulfobacteriota bacterium]